ncbi:SDR family oxidoreductase [Desulfonatronum thioautotrophicum]|uniref:SDR family oxidoreductase n=1 Tax=Desulfonatronum thioautotrophicum TaxID=617001 RepID=UPI0005EB920F|nr:SDR family oxidoreductase [Desulfonatronum thioautotrophicum]
MQTSDLHGKVAVITGASSGIGRAVAQALHGLGMRLVLNARRPALLEELGRELQAAVVPGDVTDPAIPGRLLDTALQSFGRCDVVLNNAGVITSGTVEDIDIEAVCAMVRVNVEATFRVAYTFVRHFQSQGRGHLVNTSSVLGTKVRPFAGAYCGTKSAIEALSEALRLELAGTAVAVTCVEPGLALTDLHRDLPEHPAKGMGINHPLRPEDVARCVVFALTQPEHVRIPRIMVLPGEHQI